MKKKNVIFAITFILLVACVVFIFIGLSYAFFEMSEEGSKNIIEVKEGLDLELINEDTVSIKDTMPMRDDWAIENQESYKFSLKNTGEDIYDFTITMQHIEVIIPIENLRWSISLDNGNSWLDAKSLTDFSYNGRIFKNEQIDFELKLWVDKTTTNDYQDKNYEGKILIDAMVASEQVLVSDTGELKIDLYDTMVPIRWSNGLWVKADHTNVNNDWYNYDSWLWANIALVNDETLYDASVGTEVPMENILAMYVWIPRYRYKLWNVGNTVSSPQEIEIIFEDVNTTKSTGSANGSYLTHPAFTFGEDELNGFWVGKFETSANTNSDCYLNPSTANCNEKISSITPRIVPNVDSLKYTNVSGMFNVSQKFKNYSLDKTLIDAHLMKNMEWGAVAYLSHSKYGKYGHGSYTGANKEIYSNNYALSTGVTMTGCGSGAPGSGSAPSTTTTTCPYTYEKTLGGVGASTTGTIHGIYDMAGGAHEYVMGNMVDESGNFYVRSSGFKSTPNNRYYNSYAYNTSNLIHTKGLLGDATRETINTLNNTYGAWYSDNSSFVNNESSWFIRGGAANNGANTGIFSFYPTAGYATSNVSSRSVLSNLN